MEKSAQTYCTTSRIIRAVFVSEPGTYDLDGVPFEADSSHVGSYATTSHDGEYLNIILYSKANFERMYQIPATGVP